MQPTDKIQPSCPYCGSKMVSSTRLKANTSGIGVRWQCFFHCPTCHASAPKILIDCNTEEEAISAGNEAAMVRHLLAEDVVSKEKFEIMKADRDSWKEAFGESNEKFAAEVQRRKNVERENQRLRAIIAQHLPGDAVCAHCEHFDQCKHEAVTLSELLEKENPLFWTCDGYSHFVPKETL